MVSRVASRYYLRSCSSNPNDPSERLYSPNLPSVPDENVKVLLERLSILDNPENRFQTFYVEDDKIRSVKRNVSTPHNAKTYFFILIVSLLLLTFLVVYFKDALNSSSIVTRRLIAKLQVAKLGDVNVMSVSCFLHNVGLGAFAFVNCSSVKRNATSARAQRRAEVSHNDVRDFVKDYFWEMKSKENFKPGKLSFIEEQCRMAPIEPRVADCFENDQNSSDTNDINLLSDYASYANGAKILSTFDTKPYGDYRIPLGALHYVFGVDHLTLNDLAICRFSDLLCGYLKRGPTSMLQEWRRPGECWAFKGSTGRIRIRLSRRVFVTAVTVEHVPMSLVQSVGVRSAPKRFSIVGIDKLDSPYPVRNTLGTYMYLLNEINVQTFTLSPEYATRPYEALEFIVESNHGNKAYTCVYRLRVHGHS